MQNIFRSARATFTKLLRRDKRSETNPAKKEQPAEDIPLQAKGSAGERLKKPPLLAEDESKEAGRHRKYRKPKPRKPPWSINNFEVAPKKGVNRFHDFAIPLQMMHGIADLDWQYCTPIQSKALATVLEGKDLVGKANTGTGKTAVFLVAILSRLMAGKKAGKGCPRALVIAPTRELVVQIAKDGRRLGRYCRLSIQMAYGGTDYQKQQEQLRDRSCDLLIATPGRLLDFINKKIVNLGSCKILVLDEADRMLDMGFIPDVRRIVGRLPGAGERQTMLFSATVPDNVKRLASQWCVKPLIVEAEPEQVAVDTVEQSVYLTTTEEKYRVLYNLIVANPDDRIIVFANMKNEAKRLAERLKRNGLDAVLLSGDVAQNKRLNRLERFRDGKVKILVATDVAGRGIHIEGITFVVNYTLPYEPEDYVHRIGRTGRAGASGKAVSFACEEGSFYLPAIEEFLEKKIECVLPAEELLQPVPPAAPPKKQSGGKSQRNRRRRTPRRKPKGATANNNAD